MSRFPTAGHLLSWAGLCPRQDESAGKRRSTRLKKGAPWLKTALVQAAWAAVPPVAEAPRPEGIVALEQLLDPAARVARQPRDLRAAPPLGEQPDHLVVSSQPRFVAGIVVARVAGTRLAGHRGKATADGRTHHPGDVPTFQPWRHGHRPREDEIQDVRVGLGPGQRAAIDMEQRSRIPTETTPPQ